MLVYSEGSYKLYILSINMLRQLKKEGSGWERGAGRVWIAPGWNHPGASLGSG